MIAAAHDGKIYWLEIEDGERLVFNNQMDKKSIERYWQRTVKETDGDHFKALLQFANEFKWKVGCIQ